MEFAANAGLIVLLLIMTYSLSTEGLWGSSLMFFNVLFSALIALNTYELLAKLMIENQIMAWFAETLCLFLVFLVTLLIFRVLTSMLGRTMVRFPVLVETLGKLAFSFAAAAIATGIVLLGFESAPVHKKVFGGITAETHPPYNLGLDVNMLDALHYLTTEGGMSGGFFGEEPSPEGQAWLERLQRNRPHGASESSSTPAGGGPPGQ